MALVMNVDRGEVIGMHDTVTGKVIYVAATARCKLRIAAPMEVQVVREAELRGRKQAEEKMQ